VFNGTINPHSNQINIIDIVLWNIIDIINYSFFSPHYSFLTVLIIQFDNDLSSFYGKIEENSSR
jgi:hypothetical protein